MLLFLKLWEIREELVMLFTLAKVLSMTRRGFYGSIGGQTERGLWLYRPCDVKVRANADWLCLIANMKRTSCRLPCPASTMRQG
jgi:hypothetical protein